MSEKTDIHTDITNRIVKAIEEGNAGGFRLPWNRSGASGLPKNISSQNNYRGINILSLWMTALHQGYAQAVWGIYRQWQEKDCQVRKGEKSSLVVFYKSITVEDETGAEQGETTSERLIARASHVFNAAQVEGWQQPTPLPAIFSPLQETENFAKATGAAIREAGSKACYSSAQDIIHMPDRSRFQGSDTMSAAESYYATLMHELTHWTGAKPRLARDLKNRFGSEAYAMEELVAELGATFLCADLAITPEQRPDHAGYIATWLKVLKSDKRAIFTAASKAQQAVDYLKGGHDGEAR